MTATGHDEILFAGIGDTAQFATRCVNGGWRHIRRLGERPDPIKVDLSTGARTALDPASCTAAPLPVVAPSLFRTVSRYRRCLLCCRTTSIRYGSSARCVYSPHIAALRRATTCGELFPSVSATCAVSAPIVGSRSMAPLWSTREQPAGSQGPDDKPANACVRSSGGSSFSRPDLGRTPTSVVQAGPMPADNPIPGRSAVRTTRYTESSDHAGRRAQEQQPPCRALSVMTTDNREPFFVRGNRRET